MWAFAVIIGLLILASYFVLAPLLYEEDSQDDLEPKPEDVLEALELKKEGAYLAIREMEFDFHMGKLTEEDLDVLKQQYLEEAAGYMKQIDALREKKDAEPAAGNDDPEEESHDRTAAGPAKEPAAEKFIYCPFCGRRAAFESRFCTACGTNLTEDDREV